MSIKEWSSTVTVPTSMHVFQYEWKEFDKSYSSILGKNISPPLDIFADLNRQLSWCFIGCGIPACPSTW